VNTEALARAVREKDEADARAKLQHETLRFGLPDLDAAAEVRLRYLAGRASEVAALLKETADQAGDRDAILAKHPLLRPYYVTIENERDALRDRVFGQQSRLVRARAAYAALTPADIVPDATANEVWRYFSKWGFSSPRIFAVYEALANAHTRLEDIDENIDRLKQARRALNERLQAIANVPAR